MSATVTRLRVRPDIEVVGDSADQVHLCFVNHTATFVSVPVTRVVRALVEVFRTPTERDDAVRVVCDRMGAETEFVSYVLDLLDRAQCLHPVSASSDQDARGPLHDFWAAQGDDPTATAARLAAQRVVLLVPSALRTGMAALLDASGLSATVIAPEPGDPLGPAVEAVRAQAAAGSTTLGVWGFSYRSRLAREVMEISLASKRPVLFGNCEGRVGRVGPLVIPHATACLMCVSSRLLSTAGSAEVTAQAASDLRPAWVPEARVSHPAFERAVSGFFVVELTQFLLDDPPASIGGFVEYVFGQGQAERRPVQRAPHCVCCHPAVPSRFGWDATFRGPVLATETP